MAFALLADGQSLSYPALASHVDAMQARLADAGVSAGARVGLLSTNCAEAVIAIHAIWRLGAVVVALNTRLTARELAPQRQRADVRLLLCNADTVALAKSFAATTPMLIIDQPAEAASRLSAQVSQQPDDALAALMFTSGTSGAPKAVMLTHGNLRASAEASAARLGVRPNDRWLCVLPLFHIGGLAIVHRSALYGTCVDLWRKFDAERVIDALNREPVTLISLVPTMLKRMLDLGWRASPSLRLVLLGGAAASPELMAAASAAGVNVATTYGLTEACSQVATALPALARRKPASVGTALPGTRVRVVDATDADCAPDVPGEVIVRGPTVMAGYLDDPDATARALRDGWLRTGDIGYLDADGDLFILQRRSDLIVTGGENVYPAEVEAVLRAHPDVADCAVVGMPSTEWGQTVAAVIVARTPMTSEALDAHCRARLAGYKVPRAYRFVDALPLNAAGKVDRARAVEMLNEG
jgi:O-succinylbenzoic acid--CoA ligase